MQLPYTVRSLGQRLLGRVRVPVRTGINRGFKWSVASSGRGYGSGTFGRDRLGALEAVVRRGECFFDLGAHKGFMSLAASRMVGPEGTVVAVEPGRSNLWFLQHHVSWNQVGNVRIVHAAVGAEAGTVAFGGRGDSLAYQVGVGTDQVPLMSLTEIVAEQGVAGPGVIKMDIEGHELDALRGAAPLLGADVALLVSVHSRPLYDSCSKVLEDLGFRLFPSHEIGRRLSGEIAEWGGDHDLLAVGSERPIDETAIARLPLMRGA